MASKLKGADFWTEARVAQLKTLVDEGMSAGEIEAEFRGEVSRNAVIGKVHRLKLSFHRAQGMQVNRGGGRPRGSRPAGLNEPITSKRAALIKAFAENSATNQHDPTVVFVASPRCEDISGGVAFLDLRAHHCRAPLDGRDRDGLMLSCGKPIREFTFTRHGKTVECSYCPQHAARFFSGYQA